MPMSHMGVRSYGHRLYERNASGGSKGGLAGVGVVASAWTLCTRIPIYLKIHIVGFICVCKLSFATISCNSIVILSCSSKQ